MIIATVNNSNKNANDEDGNKNDEDNNSGNGEEEEDKDDDDDDDDEPVFEEEYGDAEDYTTDPSDSETSELILKGIDIEITHV
ncbi:hypothetical protein M0813_00898 [Anaeramoeba flamelloides]|uniref:Uncharacterized protein n=1 Tax=Anaeramoeba flamelloides TaxID=1746091 RepID=A0ABQ8X8A6_9EUKA|nr:hypothetical protein M0813_00898 [Anaeramoeba flamelloides]